MEGTEGLQLKWNELKLTAVLMPSQQPKSQYASLLHPRWKWPEEELVWADKVSVVLLCSGQAALAGTGASTMVQLCGRHLTGYFGPSSKPARQTGQAVCSAGHLVSY